METRLIRLRGCGWRRIGVSVVIGALALCGTVGRTGQGQDAAKPEPAKMMAKDAEPDWEVATVKRSDPNDTRGQHISLRGQDVGLCCIN